MRCGWFANSFEHNITYIAVGTPRFTFLSNQMDVVRSGNRTFNNGNNPGLIHGFEPLAVGFVGQLHIHSVTLPPLTGLTGSSSVTGIYLIKMDIHDLV